MEIVWLSSVFRAKGVGRAKLTVREWHLLQYGSDMQKGSFSIRRVIMVGYFSESTTPGGKIGCSVCQ